LVCERAIDPAGDESIVAPDEAAIEICVSIPTCGKAEVAVGRVLVAPRDDAGIAVGGAPGAPGDSAVLAAGGVAIAPCDDAGRVDQAAATGLSFSAAPRSAKKMGC
jgi:hypothetical protein